MAVETALEGVDRTVTLGVDGMEEAMAGVGSEGVAGIANDWILRASTCLAPLSATHVSRFHSSKCVRP